MTNIFIVKGNIVLTDEVLFDAYMKIVDGKIVSISNKKHVESYEVIDATGKYIFPGAIDAHVHCYSSLEEGFSHATQSAAAGGVTTIIEMPYDADEKISNSERFKQKKALLEKESFVDVAMLATIEPEGELTEIERLADAGACGFKVSLFNTHPVRFPKISEGELFEAFQWMKKTNRPVGVHAETDSIVTRYIARYRNKGFDPLSHCKSRPKVAESTAALTALELAYYTGAKLHLYHCTFPRIFSLVEYYKRNGVNVTAETCTHYLLFAESDMEQLKGRGKINPPIREASDRHGLWALLAQDKIDMVTSDHAPWLLERKIAKNIFDSAAGAPGVEVLFPILFSEGVIGERITPLQLAKVIAQNPAERFGLGHRKGKLQVGYDADFIIVDPNKTDTIDEERMHTSSDWSPYDGLEVQGKIDATFVRGEKVYDGETIVADQGFGTFVTPRFVNQEGEET